MQNPQLPLIWNCHPVERAIISSLQYCGCQKISTTENLAISVAGADRSSAHVAENRRTEEATNALEVDILQVEIAAIARAWRVRSAASWLDTAFHSDVRANTWTVALATSLRSSQ